jgi:hypothetical protein
MPNDQGECALRSHARRQHGVFTLAQALACGYSRATVRRRIAAATWQEPAPRVYRVALGADPDWYALTMAHALSSGGVACRRSALALYGLMTPPAHPEVLAGRAQRTTSRQPQRSTDCLPCSDTTTVDGARRRRPCARSSTSVVGWRPTCSRTCSTRRSSAGWSPSSDSRLVPVSSGRRGGTAVRSCCGCSPSAIPSSGARRTSGKRGCSGSSGRCAYPRRG